MFVNCDKLNQDTAIQNQTAYNLNGKYAIITLLVPIASACCWTVASYEGYSAFRGHVSLFPRRANGFPRLRVFPFDKS